MGYDFDYWLNNYFHQHLDSLYAVEEINHEEYIKYKKFKKINSDYTKKVLFNKLFNRIDFETRAQKINAFNLTSHSSYTTMLTLITTRGKNRQQQNKTMAFVPGGFMKEESTKPEDEFHFLRLLFSNQIEAIHCLIEIYYDRTTKRYSFECRDTIG